VPGDEPDLFVVLYYTDRPDPRAAYAEFHAIADGWRNSGRHFPDVDRARKLIHSGMYRPSIGHYEFYE
jgi:hypothetical protein